MIADEAMKQGRLYHTKKNQGTTIHILRQRQGSILYHTKKNQGTTIAYFCNSSVTTLYHTKKNQGTTIRLKKDRPKSILYHTKKNQPHHRKSPRRYLVRRSPFPMCFEYTIFFFSLQRNQPRPFFGRAVFLYCDSISNKLLN